MTDYTASLPVRDNRETWCALVLDEYVVAMSQHREQIIARGRSEAAQDPRSVIRGVEFRAFPDEDPREAARRVGATNPSYPAFWEHWGEPSEPSVTEPRGTAPASGSSSSPTGWVVAVLIAVVVAVALAWALLHHSGDSSKPSPTSPATSSSTSSSSSSSSSSQTLSTSTVTSTETPSTVTQTQTQTQTQSSSSSSSTSPSSSSSRTSGN